MQQKLTNLISQSASYWFMLNSKNQASFSFFFSFCFTISNNKKLHKTIHNYKQCESYRPS